MAMVVTRTPYRISFFGGGSDYPSWYLKEGGAVLSTTIDKYCYISCRDLPPFFNFNYRVVWSHIETVNTVAEILHPAVREGLRYLGYERGLEIVHQGDLPARGGMGSSSSFAVGFIKAIHCLQNQSIDRHGLTLKAIELEQVRLNENVGSQDQVAAAHGGLNVVRFNTDGGIQITPLALDATLQQRLQSHLMLFFTGTSRLASEVARNVIGSLPSRQTEVRTMRAMVDTAAEALKAGDLALFGDMLHEGWQLKRSLSSEVSNQQIDEIYAAARAAGATGGKLLGAGSSGFMLFFVPPERQEAVRTALKHLLHVPFQFETEGSTVIYNNIAKAGRAAS